MTDLEDRLRNDLRDLADALAGDRTGDGSTEPATDEPPATRSGPARTLVLATCAVLVLVAAFVVVGDDGTERTAVDTVDESLAPDGPGTWEAMSDAPIARRAHPASLWTGTEALFWAGSSLDRSFAYGDGAAYDPATDTWRTVPVPGWGHPGLVSVVVDGQLFATAKGSIGRLSVDTGEWIEVTPPTGIEVQTIAAGNGGIWALGTRTGDRQRLAVTFRDADTDRWTEGDDLTGPEGTAALEALADLEQPVLWSGDRLVIWSARQGLAYRPAGGWTTLPPLPDIEDQILASRIIVHDGKLIAFAERATDDVTAVRPLRFDPSGTWVRIGATDLPIEDLARTTIADAGESIMLLPPQGPPLSLHVPSGQRDEHLDAPIQGIERPGTVWTGAQLVVWGGVVDSADEPVPGGMVWTPADHQTGGTDRSMPSTDGTDASSWSGAEYTELPRSGIAIATAGELVLHDYAGTELARTRATDLAELQSGHDREVAVVRPGPSVDVVPADLSEVPPGCRAAATGGGVRVALCGGEAQQPQRIESFTPGGERGVLAEPPDGSNGIGHWQMAIPSPDGRWVLATWSGECESLTAFLLPTSGDGPVTTIDGRAGLADAIESSGIGWSPDGRAVVKLGTGVCGAAADEPGVHLFDPADRRTELVITLSDPRPTVHLWRARPYGNDAESIFSDVLEQLDLQGCCGEPSHGGLALTAGARWDGYDIPVGATPPGSTDTVPFNDLVLSSEPIDLDGAPATAGDADLGPFVAFSCGDRIWTFGGAGVGDRPTAEAVRGLAAAVLPRLGCTAGDRPLATGHGPAG